MMPYLLTKLTSLKTVSDFRSHVGRLGIDLPIDDPLILGEDSPILSPISWGSKTIGNRIAIQPMEGWDATNTGGTSEATLRRWGRFGESGAKLIWGGEAMAIRPDGRANPNQLLLLKENQSDIERLRNKLVESHREHHGKVNDLVIGFQLTHSGRFCRPNDKKRWEPRVAYRHPVLDTKFSVDSDDMVWTDMQLDELIGDYAKAAAIAKQVGADFVDIKCCHGYLLHEFLARRRVPEDMEVPLKTAHDCCALLSKRFSNPRQGLASVFASARLIRCRSFRTKRPLKLGGRGKERLSIILSWFHTSGGSESTRQIR